MAASSASLSALFFLLGGAAAVVFALLAFVLHKTSKSLPTGGSARQAGALRAGSTFLLVLAGLCLALVAAETVFRVLVPGGYFRGIPREASTPEAFVESLPDGQAFWEYRSVLDFDENGFRGGAPLPPDPGRFRVALLGDSVAYGAYVPFVQTFGYLLRNQLDTECGGADIYNVAVPAYSTIQERVSLERKALKGKPDLVLLAALPNDVEMYTFAGGAAFDVRLDEAKGFPEFRHFPLPTALNKFLLINSVFYQYLTFRGMRAHDQSEGRFFNQVSRCVDEAERIRVLCKDAGATLVVLLFPMLDRPLDEPEGTSKINSYQIFDALRSWAAKTGVQTIDIRPLLASLPLDRVAHDSCCHLTPEGHRAVASSLLDELHRLSLLPARCRK